MDTRHHIARTLYDILRQNMSQLRSSADLLAALLLSLGLTFVSPNKGIVSSLVQWIQSIATEVGGGLLEDELQAWRRKGTPPSFEEIRGLVERMQEEERQTLKNLLMDLLPAFLDEVMLSHREVLTAEIQRQAEICKEHISTEGAKAVEQLVGFILTLHTDQYERLLQELETIKRLLDLLPSPSREKPGVKGREFLPSPDHLLDRIWREIGEEWAREMEER